MLFQNGIKPDKMSNSNTDRKLKRAASWAIAVDVTRHIAAQKMSTVQMGFRLRNKQNILVAQNPVTDPIECNSRIS